MKKLALVSSIALIACGSVAANPYAAWQSSDDDTLKIKESFNSDYQSTVTEDNDITKTYIAKEDNDITKTFTKSEDNDIVDSFNRDLDITKTHQHSEDNDYTSSYKHSEDNDYTSSWDYDSEVITPTLTSVKKQDQDAGHKSSTDVYGSAAGHSQAVQGGPVLVSVGEEDTYNAGPVITNNNNFAPNMATIYGSNAGPIMQSGSFVGGDVKSYSLGDIGNTTATALGNVGNQSTAATMQSGDSANGIDDDMISGVKN